MWKVLSTEVMHGLAVLALIIFGAIVHATAQLKVARDRQLEFTVTDFWILTLIASFSGVVFGLATFLTIGDNIIAVALFAGIGAFLGMAGLNRLANVLLDVITQSRKK